MGTRPISDYLRRNFRGVYPSSAPPPARDAGNEICKKSRQLRIPRLSGGSPKLANETRLESAHPADERKSKTESIRRRSRREPQRQEHPPNVPQKWSDRAPGISIRERENDCGGGPRRLPHLEFHLTRGAFWRLAAHLRSALGWDA